MADKRELIENVKNWISIDNDIKELQKTMREKRKNSDFRENENMQKREARNEQD